MGFYWGKILFNLFVNICVLPLTIGCSALRQGLPVHWPLSPLPDHHQWPLLHQILRSLSWSHFAKPFSDIWHFLSCFLRCHIFPSLYLFLLSLLLYLLHPLWPSPRPSRVVSSFTSHNHHRYSLPHLYCQPKLPHGPDPDSDIQLIVTLLLGSITGISNLICS